MDAVGTVISSNPYFSAGIGLLATGTAAAFLRKGVLQGSQLLRRRLLVTLEIPSKDKSYHWVLNWLSKWMNSVRSNQLSVETTFRQIDNGASVTEFNLVPGLGNHWMKYQGAWMMIYRQRDTKLIDLHSGTPWETITITTLRRDQPLLHTLLEDAKSYAIQSQVGKTVVYTSYGPEWRPFGQPRKKRPLGSVVLDNGVSDYILDDVKRFINNWKWYNERGIPYRRGYLLHGPPGSGKSSFIQALAGELEYNICVLNLSERGLTDDRLNHLLTNMPMRSFMLLEDVDAAFNKRTQSDEKGYSSSVTFSGLLNALDGVAAAEERIIFMTTNHLDRLDPALIRPGRVDVKQKIDYATDYQIKEMFLRFYEGEKELAEEFVKRVRNVDNGDEISTAGLQGHFVFWRDSPKSAVANAEQAVNIGR
ncbi:BCS1 N terminal-domain-containing protein [Paraphysoderma sedebokerense]|nr:BCS1 N terminal-domain-containing protein [Paraphysoderma sedebokerense]